MQLGFIGFGEASFELAKGLKDEGVEKIKAYDPLWNHDNYREILSNKAEAAQVILTESQQGTVREADLVIVAVPANHAVEVSKELESILPEGLLYIDVTAASPDDKKIIANNVSHAGCKFVDAAMMGSLPLFKHKVPILASGEGADNFISSMTPYQMKITKVNNIPGDATAVKLIRSIYMKGVVGLYLELLQSAHKFGIEDYVIDSLNETINGKTFEETMNRLVTGTSIHALRRSIELEGTISMLDSVGIDSSMTKAAKKKIESLVELNIKDKFNGENPESWIQVIESY